MTVTVKYVYEKVLNDIMMKGIINAFYYRSILLLKQNTKISLHIREKNILVI